MKHDVEAIMKGAHVPLGAPGAPPQPAPFAGPSDFNSSKSGAGAAPAKSGSNSHLARGLALWKAGDRTGARKEFEALAAENPDSPIATGLLNNSKVERMAAKPAAGSKG